MVPKPQFETSKRKHQIYQKKKVRSNLDQYYNPFPGNRNTAPRKWGKGIAVMI